MARKKTLYEILEIPASAGREEILAAHRQKLLELQSNQSGLSQEEFDFQLKLLNLAVDTLSDPLLRRDYDDKLMSRKASAQGQEPFERHAGSSTLTRRAEALALRADALALRADAMSINTDISTFGTQDPPSLAERIFGGMKSSLRSILIALGTVAAIVMVIQTSIVVFAVRNGQSAAAAAAAAAKAEEQMIIQEYYQKYGVRPANAAEARLLEEERRRRENDER